MVRMNFKCSVEVCMVVDVVRIFYFKVKVDL